MIQSIEGSCSIGIDGKWGTGKTFFVKQSKLVIDSLNPNVPFFESDEAVRVRNIWDGFQKNNDELLRVPMVTAYYDTWQHDDEKEPLLSLLYEIMKDNYNGCAEEKRKSWGGILASVAGIICDRDIHTFLEEIKGHDIFADQKQNEDLDLLVEKFLQSFLPERGEKLVIFVDELDRCSPAFAVKLLERIKHYFLCENIVFVFSINFGELQNTVKNYYGGDFDSCRYMDRFFDIRMELPPIDMEKYVQSIERYGSKDLRQTVCLEIIRQMNMGMREVSRYLQMSKVCAYKYTNASDSGFERRRFLSHDGGNADLIAYFVIVPIIMGLKITDTKQYDEFIYGKNHMWLERILMSDALGDWVTSLLLDTNESYQEIEGKLQVRENQKIKDVYEAIFIKTYDHGEYETKVGKAIFEKGLKHKILKAVSFVSPYADYTI
ncbi:KAP family P-loop domain-containing protein [Butyrivibrio sp. INlla18]|uniref:KAP family P-loop NTPase fold protein n=1 Tax=Butyrivibrio sp. INlla18 TaxID=1520806 RepID=UPI00088ABD92|nr:P-loop NTPase fold protein [Butyrivibrio sp. INlla18]SDA62590.1 KAP family P-loop domain-containing protein [Butyrivibrio sp. INlla18]